MTEVPSTFNPLEQVEVEWNQEDLLIPALQLGLGEITSSEYASLPQHNKFSLTRGEISTFCSPCDYLGEDGTCKMFGLRRQTRYAAREWCGLAEVNEVRGTMTKNGFEPTK